MILEFASMSPRLYLMAGASDAWATAFGGFGEPVEEVTLYFDPSFNVVDQTTDEANKLKARDPRPPAGRLTRR